MKTLLVTVRHEGLMSQIEIVARVEYQGEEENIEARFRGAAKAFAETEEGKAHLDLHYGNFNWGDALTQIPEGHLLTFGILKIEILAASPIEMTILNHDYRLV